MIISVEVDVVQYIPDAVSVEVDISEHMPGKTDPIVLYNPHSRDFFVSTTVGESYDGRLTLAEVVDEFIGVYGMRGILGAEDAAPFIEDLEAAISRIKSCIEEAEI